MKTVIFFVLCVSCSHAYIKYHKKADKEYQDLTESSVQFFPKFMFSNEEEKTKLKVSRKGVTGLFIRPEPTYHQFCLHARFGEGIYYLTSFRFDFKPDEIILTFLFDLQKPQAHKLMLTSRVFAQPEDPELRKHAEEHAVFIEPMTSEEIQALRDQPIIKVVRTTSPVSITWIKSIIEYTPPLMTMQSRSSDIKEYLSPPVVMDPNQIAQLVELQKELKQ